MTLHKCPACDGMGIRSRPPGIPSDQISWMSTSVGPYECKPCDGTGILWTYYGMEGLMKAKALDVRVTVRQAARQYEEKLEQMYQDAIDEIANRYGISTEDVKRLWDQEGR